MYDALSIIESCYGCVAEYNRCMEEKEEERETYGYEPSYDEWMEEQMEIEEEKEPIIFEVGQTYRQVGFYGGVTYYTVKEINLDRTQILLAEHWVDDDGEGERPAEWHKLENENGNERALEWTSKEFGDVWIYA